MTRILSLATAGVYTEQLADVDHHHFLRVDYIELHDLHHLHKDYCTWTLHLRIRS